MCRVLFLALLAISMTVQGEDKTAAEPPCLWLGTAPTCAPDYCPLDSTEFATVTAAKSHYQHAQAFGKDCVSGVKRLCCKNEGIYADPARHCGYFVDSFCPFNTTTVFMKRIYSTNWYNTQFDGFCCDPIVFELKEREN